MRSIAAGALVALVAGCPARETVDCGNGFLCPTGLVCAEQRHCGEPALVEACVDQGKHDYDSCDAPTFTGTCRSGVCTECSVDLAGCGHPQWEAMTSPASPHNLLALWVPTDARPVTLAFAAGQAGTIVQYDGVTWKSIAGPATTADFTSIWASGADDVYVLSNVPQLFHFDGSTWQDITTTLPANASFPTVLALAGAARNDVYAVGIGETVDHFDGTSWTSLHYMAGGATFRAVTATASGPVAVGGARIFEAGTTSAPAELANQFLRSISTRGGNLVAVGSYDTANTRLALFERFGGTWMAEGSGAGVDLLTVWNDFAGGRTGQIMHAEGTTWTPMTTLQGGQDVNAIAGSSGGDVFAVTNGGAIWRYFVAR